jgi:DNA-binding NarL/FixJ family response regulator
VASATAAADEAGGRTVLTSRPLETEAAVAFSGLSDLLADVPEAVYAGLPPPQRSAVLAALLLDEAEGEVDPRAVAAGLRNVLQGDAAGALLVIDDAQWLDPASARALEQALAHVRPGSARLLVAARPAARLPAVAMGGEQLQLPPLGEGALFHVVKDHLGVVLDRGALRALQRASGGNPLHALELARTRHGPGPSALPELVAARLSELPRPTLLALLAAALADTPTVEVVAAARQTRPDALLDVLESARGAGLVVVRGERVEFCHPLFASGVVDTATSSDVRDTHHALALLASDPDLGVRHLALSAPDADAGLADALDAAADRLWRRGAWDAACDLAELAVDRTPDGDVRFGRMLRLGKRLHRTGRPTEAERWLDDVRRNASGGLSWAAGVALGQILVVSGRLDALRPLVEELEAAPLPARLRAVVRLQLAPDLVGRRSGEQLALLASGNALLEGLPDEVGLASERAAGLTSEYERRLFMGERRTDLLTLAEDLERREPSELVMESCVRVRAHDLLLGDHHDEARPLFDRLLHSCAEIGDDVSVPVLLTQWGRLEERAGRWDRAAALVDEGRRSAVGQSQVYDVLLDLQEARLRSLRGDGQHTRARVEAAASALEVVDDDGFSAIAQRVVGESALLVGDHEAAWTALARSAAYEDAAQWHDPGGLLLLGDYVDAALAVGEVEAAVERTAVVRMRAESLGGRENVLAACEYAVLAVLAATGELDEAVAVAPAVIASYDADDRCLLERGRTLLLAGRVYRRAKAKRRAASVLGAAVDLFAGLSCRAYLGQARDELARVGLRPSAPAGLTATEDQVARLAAGGLRNHEIADQVFVSPRTVEAILTRTYRKLGIRSRAELGRALDAVPGD